MSGAQPHKLTLIRKYTSGAEEWFCPICGRRFVMQWAPEYQRIVLEVGDETAVHNTEKGVMTVQKSQAEDPWLAPWKEWSESGKLESLWRD
jgi:hypothetical protein